MLRRFLLVRTVWSTVSSGHNPSAILAHNSIDIIICSNSCFVKGANPLVYTEIRPSGTIISSILSLQLNVIYYFISNSFISRLLYKRNKDVNNWVLISSHRASEAPFKLNILCIFIVLSPEHCFDLTVSERDLHSRSLSELLRGRVRKVDSPSHPFIFYSFFLIFVLYFFSGSGSPGAIGVSFCFFRL